MVKSASVINVLVTFFLLSLERFSQDPNRQVSHRLAMAWGLDAVTNHEPRAAEADDTDSIRSAIAERREIGLQLWTSMAQIESLRRAVRHLFGGS